MQILQYLYISIHVFLCEVWDIAQKRGEKEKTLANVSKDKMV